MIVSFQAMSKGVRWVRVEANLDPLRIRSMRQG